jgi:purine-binding chemotaxis protein CheW
LPSKEFVTGATSGHFTVDFTWAATANGAGGAVSPRNRRRAERVRTVSPSIGAMHGRGTTRAIGRAALPRGQTETEGTMTSAERTADWVAAAQRLAGKYMTFQLADETYGIGILKVREIVGVLEITRVPRAPEVVRGVINLRGKVIPVFDVRLAFGMAAAEITDQTVITVVQVETAGRTLTIGALVDRVLEVLSVDAAAIEDPSTLTEACLDTSLILGIAKVEERVVFLLDLARVLTREEVGDLIEAAA